MSGGAGFLSREASFPRGRGMPRRDSAPGVPTRASGWGLSLVGPAARGASAACAAFFAGLLGLAGPGTAQGVTTCLPRAAFVDLLAVRFGEGPLWGGLSQTGLLTEGFVNAATGSWTVTVTTAQGVTCLLSAGQGFEVYALPAAAPGVPG